MSRILVTGAGGFIGSHLVRRLIADDHDVTLLAHRPGIDALFQAKNCRPIAGDVRDFDSLVRSSQGMDIVFHLAGRVMALSQRDFDEVNTGGAENVAKACASAGNPPVLVLVSSLAAAGPSERGRPRALGDPIAPISQYGRSKRAGERAAARFANDAPISIIRPPFVFGGGDRLSWPVFKMIKRHGLQVIIRGADLELTLAHVDDLVTALVAIAERGERLAPAEWNDAGEPETTGVYFAGDSQVVTYSEMGRMIAAAYDRKVWAMRIGSPMMWCGCAASTAFANIVRRPNVLNFDKFREARVPAWTCDASALKAKLGVAPAAPLPERIEQTAAWYDREEWK